MTVGTHWPRLQLGTEELPAPDKLIHLIAFAGLAFLLWRSGWVPRIVHEHAVRNKYYGHGVKFKDQLKPVAKEMAIQILKNEQKRKALGANRARLRALAW